jgi:MarR family transcriptional regulator for hemolysin
MNGIESEIDPVKLIGHAHRAFARIVDAPLRELGFALGQLPVLVALKKGQALSQSELARIARVEQSSMAQLLNRMERDGLIQRVPDPADKRSRLISLTATASRNMPKGKAIMDATRVIALKGFSKPEIDQLSVLMGRIHANLLRAEEDGVS